MLSDQSNDSEFRHLAIHRQAQCKHATRRGHSENTRCSSGRGNRHITQRLRHHSFAKCLAPGIKTLGARQSSGGKLMLSRAHTLIDENGGISDEATGKLLSDFFAGLCKFCRKKINGIKTISWQSRKAILRCIDFYTTPG